MSSGTDQTIHAPMPGAEGLTEPLRSRWSPSVFDVHHELGRDDVITLLHAAQWAPSSGNSQPWRFFVAERGSAAHKAIVPHLSRGNSGWVPRASVVFLAGFALDQESGPAGPGGELVSVYALGQAAAHLTLQAQAMGLWTHQFRGADWQAIAGELGLPPYARLVAGIAVGRRGDPAEVSERDREREHRIRRRKPLAEIAYADAWGAPWPGLPEPSPDTLDV
jgi:nitroreductase